MRKYGLPVVFVAAMMMLSQGSATYAARGEKVPQSPCAFMLDIDKRIEVPFLGGDCVLCRCVLKGVEQDVFRIRYSFRAFSREVDTFDFDEEARLSDGDCDDSGEQIDAAEVFATRWVIVEKDPAGQNPCIRGKEDVELTLMHAVLSGPPLVPVFTGKGVGVVGVGNPLKGELCCNFDKNQAVIHLQGFGHDSFGGPAPKKKCWARVKFISQINPSDPTNPCSIFPVLPPFPAQFVINGVEGCICDSTFQEPVVQ